MTDLMWWIIGVVFVFNAMRIVLKFMNKVFKRLGSDAAMDYALDKTEDAMDNAANSVAGYLKKQKRRRKEQEQPIVTIR